MCLATIVKTGNGPVHQQCVQEVYGSVKFLNIPTKERLIYWCSHCGKVSDGTQTPEQLFAEWERKGVQFEIAKIAEN